VAITEKVCLECVFGVLNKREVEWVSQRLIALVTRNNELDDRTLFPCKLWQSIVNEIGQGVLRECQVEGAFLTNIGTLVHAVEAVLHVD